MEANGGSVLKPRAFDIDGVTRKMPHPLLKNGCGTFSVGNCQVFGKYYLITTFWPLITYEPDFRFFSDFMP